ncbi:MAG: hypothetical protein LC687_05640 [Actinobacteria bacterium]|nr:hypothetical protein [Actinomycetota bacterium]MCA1807314.1 hypothetical protein [Actinomycetota bacterium]
MSWSLKGFGTLPLNILSPRVEYTQDSAGFRKGFKWSRKAHGDCMQLVFYANPSIVDFKMREVVQLVVDEQPQFFGMIIRHPGHQSKGAGLNDPDSMEEFIVYGMSYFFKETLMGTEFSGEGGFLTNNVSGIANYAASTYLTDRIRHDSYYMPSRGEVFSQFYMPYYPMNQVLDALAQAIPNVDYGVNSEGFLYFMDMSDHQHILNYLSSSLYIEWVPIDAEEVVTSAILIVVTEPSKAIESLKSVLGVYAAVYSGGVWSRKPYIPKPEIIEYTDPVNHLPYRARISKLVGNLLRADADLLTTPAAIYTGNLTNPSNVYDDDPDTYATLTSGATSSGYMDYQFNTTSGNLAEARRIIGCRIIYSSDNADNKIVVDFTRSNASNFLGTARQLYNATLPDSGPVLGDKRIVDIIIPQSTVFTSTPIATRLLMQITWNNPGNVRVYEFVPIYLDTELGIEIAKSFIQLPAQTPATITVRNQLLEPRKKLYITDVPNFPSGILQGNVAEYEYTISPEDGKMTQIKFEQPDLSDEALIAKHISQQLDAKVIGEVRSQGTI